MNKGMTIFRIMQILFAVLTFAGLVLLLLQKVDNAGLSVVSMVFSLVFASLYNSSKKNDWAKNVKMYYAIHAVTIVLSVLIAAVLLLAAFAW